MPRDAGPASVAALNRLHRKTVKLIEQEIDRLIKSKEPVPASLVQAATGLLKATEVTAPAPKRSKVDKLAGTMPDFDSFVLPTPSNKD